MTFTVFVGPPLLLLPYSLLTMPISFLAQATLNIRGKQSLLREIAQPSITRVCVPTNVIHPFTHSSPVSFIHSAPARGLWLEREEKTDPIQFENYLARDPFVTMTTTITSSSGHSLPSLPATLIVSESKVMYWVAIWRAAWAAATATKKWPCGFVDIVSGPLQTHCIVHFGKLVPKSIHVDNEYYFAPLGLRHLVTTTNEYVQLSVHA